MFYKCQSKLWVMIPKMYKNLEVTLNYLLYNKITNLTIGKFKADLTHEWVILHISEKKSIFLLFTISNCFVFWLHFFRLFLNQFCWFIFVGQPLNQSFAFSLARVIFGRCDKFTRMLTFWPMVWFFHNQMVHFVIHSYILGFLRSALKDLLRSSK